jgi:hypothetical protein
LTPERLLGGKPCEGIDFSVLMPHIVVDQGDADKP